MNPVFKWELRRMKSKVSSTGTLYLLVALPLIISAIRGLIIKEWDLSIPLFITLLLGPASLGRYKDDVKLGLIPFFFALPISPWDIILSRALLSIIVSFALGLGNVLIIRVLGNLMGNCPFRFTPLVGLMAFVGGTGAALISPSIWMRNMLVKMLSSVAMISALVGIFMFLSPIKPTLLASFIGFLLGASGVVTVVSIRKEDLG